MPAITDSSGSAITQDSTRHYNDTSLTVIFQDKLRKPVPECLHSGLLLEPRDDGDGCDNWSYKICKAPVKHTTYSKILHKGVEVVWNLRKIHTTISDNNDFYQISKRQVQQTNISTAKQHSHVF